MPHNACDKICNYMYLFNNNLTEQYLKNINYSYQYIQLCYDNKIRLLDITLIKMSIKFTDDFLMTYLRKCYSHSWSWLKHGHHTVVGSDRNTSVWYQLAGTSLDYGLEYLGIPDTAVLVPPSDRALINMVAAISANRCKRS